MAALGSLTLMISTPSRCHADLTTVFIRARPAATAVGAAPLAGA
jgi:hypothetical protein